MAFASFMWKFDANVIDGLVNLTGWATIKLADLKQWFDIWVVDGAVNGSGWVVRQGANILRYLQTGSMQFYALFILTLVVVFGLYKFEISYMNLGWPTVTIAFILGVSLLTLLSRIVANRLRTDQEAKGEE